MIRVSTKEKRVSSSDKCIFTPINPRLARPFYRRLAPFPLTRKHSNLDNAILLLSAKPVLIIPMSSVRALEGDKKSKYENRDLHLQSFNRDLHLQSFIMQEI